MSLTAAYNGKGISRYVSPYYDPGTPVLRCNDLFGNGVDYISLQPGEGDISIDPLFKDASAGDYHLRWDSPCIDAGRSDAPGLLQIDIDGQGRTCWNAVDIGADEVWPYPIKIDIRPGAYPNNINTRSRGLVPVAVLTTPDFDAGCIDPASLVFAGASPVVKNKGLAVSKEDVDGDGDLDLLAWFNSQNLNLTKGSKSAVLFAGAFNGDAFEGTDSVIVR